MNLFQPPPISQYDLNFTIAGIPIRVHPLFWLLAALFGASANNLIYMVIWVMVVFISIVVHELGHALTMRYFGQPAYIVLYLAGGLAIRDSMRWGSGRASVSLSRRQEILISLAGPAAGFLLAGLVLALVTAMGGSIFIVPLLGILPFPLAQLPIDGVVVNTIIRTLLWVNVFWGLINLMPVYPLDGGNVTRNVMIGIDPWEGVRKSLWISVIAGAIVAGAGLILLNSIYMAFLFGFLAFQSYQSL